MALFRAGSPAPGLEGLEQAAHMPFPSPPPALEGWSGSLWHRLSGFCLLRAAEWQLDQPSWSGRLRITAKGQVAYIKLEDRTSGKGKGGLLGAEVPGHPLCKGRGSPGPDEASQGSWEPVLDIEDPSALLSLLHSPTFNCSSHCPQVLKGGFLAKHLFFWGVLKEIQILEPQEGRPRG